MNLTSVILKSLRHYWQVHLATLLAVAVTTTVLTGALTVGDSMRGSLRDLTLKRLGPIDHVVLASTFLDRDTADRWIASPEFAQAFQHAYPVLHFPAGTLELTNRNAADSAAFANSAVATPANSAAEAPGSVPEFSFDWTSVAVWAVDNGFDRLDWGAGGWPLPGDNEVVLNATAARRLGLDESQIGMLVTLRIGKPSDVPTESFIATKDDAVTSLPRLKWVGLAPDDGVGRLALSPGTETPANVFISLTTAQRLVPPATRTARGDQPLINALLVTAPTWEPVSVDAADAALRGLRPSIADAGLKVVAVDRAPLNYYSLSSVQMLLDDGQQRVVTAALQGLKYQSVLTYLANDLQLADREENGVPFSMVSALDLTADSGLPLVGGSTVHQLQGDEVLLNRWAAEDLGVEVGQSLRLRYYEPETVDGIEVEREALFRVAGIVELTTPDQPYQTLGRRTVIATFKQPPTAANDPWLTPEVPGVTDAVSIEAWDLPFETASKIRPQDDDYWQFHRTTPKAFITLGTGQRLWSSRFGDLTSYRVPADQRSSDQRSSDQRSSDQLSSDQLRQRLERAIAANLSDAGFQILPLKRQGLGGSQGSTPFDVLFLMFSMFVVFSALLLLVLFVRLGLQQRAAELGLWLAVGFAPRQVARCWWAESLLAAVGGLCLGSVAGVAYAGVMAWLMRTAWVGAVASPFLYLHWTWRSILLGGCGSFLVCALVVAWSVRRAAQGSARTLLSGRWGDGDGNRPPQRWWFQPLPRGLLLLGAIGLSIGGLFATGDAQAVAFLGGGMGALLAMLATIYAGLIQPPQTARLAWADVGRLNLARQPLRSLMIVGLVGIATFLILAVSAFRLSPTERGTAGFSYVVQTDTGVIDDLNAPAVRQRLLEQNRVADAAAKPAPAAVTTFFGFRFHDGEHASCNNPFQAGQPQVLGVQPAFVERFDDPQNPAFAWVAHTGQTAAEQQNPWRLLQRPSHAPPSASHSATASGATESGDRPGAAEGMGWDRGRPIPVIIDKNTAWYSLKVYLPGTRFTIDYPGVGPVEFELAGLLDNSLLQGVLLVAEDDFLRLFPKNVGQRYFLVAGAGGASVTELRALGQALKDSGWQIRPAAEVLAVYLAVQNTYLSAFQSLGSLGLLLGTIGLVVAQFRSILERRRELALLQALGFANPRIQALVTRETLLLMGLGFGVGLAGAAVGVLPHWWSGAADLPLAWLLAVLAAIAAIGWVAARVVGNWAVQGNLLRLLRNQ